MKNQTPVCVNCMRSNHLRINCPLLFVRLWSHEHEYKFSPRKERLVEWNWPRHSCHFDRTLFWCSIAVNYINWNWFSLKFSAEVTNQLKLQIKKQLYTSKNYSNDILFQHSFKFVLDKFLNDFKYNATTFLLSYYKLESDFVSPSSSYIEIEFFFRKLQLKFLWTINYAILCRWDFHSKQVSRVKKWDILLSSAKKCTNIPIANIIWANLMLNCVHLNVNLSECIGGKRDGVT